MKHVLAALALAAAMALPAHADVYTFSNEFSGGADCASVAFGCSVLRVTSIAGGVHFELLGTMTGTEFITEISGNIGNGAFVAPTVANVAGSGLNAVEGFSFGQDAFKADGDGYFDWILNLSSNPPRFDGTDLLTWDFLGVTLAQITGGVSQNGVDPKNAFTFATHAQGLAEGSGWFNGVPAVGPTPFDEPPNGVPEPGSLALAGLGLVGLWAGKRRKADPDPKDDEDKDDGEGDATDVKS